MAQYRMLISGVGDAGLCAADAATIDGRGEIVGLFDPRPQGVERGKNIYPDAVGGDDYEKLIDQVKPDVIILAGPDHLHAEQALVALERGCHLLIEKPLATTVADAQKVVDRTEKTGLHVMVDHTLRYVYPSRETALAAKAGMVGKVFYVQGDYIGNLWRWYHPDGERHTPWRIDKKHPQDILIGGGCHPIDLMLWTVDSPVVDVYAYSNKFCIPEFPADDCYILIMRFENGCLGKCFVSSGCRARGMGDTLEVYGSEGTLSEGKWLCEGKDTIELENTCGENTHEGHGWMGSVRDFLDTLDGKIDNPIPARAGAKTVALCEAAIKSVHSGKPEVPVRF